MLAICWVIKNYYSKQTSQKTRNLKPFNSVLFGFLSVVLWAFIQTWSSIPDGWAHPLWAMLNDHLTRPVQGSISLNPDDTLTALMRLISYGLVFWIALPYCQSSTKARRVISLIMSAGFIYSFIALMAYFSDFEGIALVNNGSNDKITGTFVNRNHFATYAGLTLLCSMALLSEGVEISGRYNLGGYIGVQRFLDNLIQRTWWPLLCFIVIGTALLLTHSRGGFLSVVIGIVILLFSLNLKRRNNYLLSALAVFMVIGGWLFLVSGDTLSYRFGNIENENLDRLTVYRITVEAIVDNPWLGFGLGCFQEGFSLYKTAEISGSKFLPVLWDYAHNSYLETIFELGVPAAFVLFFCFVKLALICLKGLFTRKKDQIFPALGLAATALIATHALVDFSMQIPAVAYLYAVLMAAACAQSFSTRKQHRQSD